MSQVTAAMIAQLVLPFLRDAQVNAGVTLTAHPMPDEKYPGVLVTDPRGSSARLIIDAYVDPEKVAESAAFDDLQEMVIFYRAEVLGIFGPWPACPVDGHRHKLGVNSDLSWTCPASGPIRRVGELDADPGVG